MTRTELLEHYLKPTDLTVKELIDRNAFAQIMQFTEAYHKEQLRIGGVGSSAKNKEAIISEMKKMTDDERLDIITEFCKYCGYLDNSCQCWNDE